MRIHLRKTSCRENPTFALQLCGSPTMRPRGEPDRDREGPMTRNVFPARQIRLMSLVVLALSAQSAPAADEEKLPPNRWVELRRDPAGARPGSATRYAPEAGAFFLWGFMNADPGLLEEHPLMEVPEYDVVSFD